mmetsp:Transcript_34413/g.82953  ORF Transcript_34413/g.82953 Transcript_34413/m.82953 type:complete len:114 (+) Transcript_34413:200-541(+)
MILWEKKKVKKCDVKGNVVLFFRRKNYVLFLCKNNFFLFSNIYFCFVDFDLGNNVSLLQLDVCYNAIVGNLDVWWDFVVSKSVSELVDNLQPPSVLRNTRRTGGTVVTDSSNL